MLTVLELNTVQHFTSTTKFSLVLKIFYGRPVL